MTANDKAQRAAGYGRSAGAQVGRLVTKQKERRMRVYLSGPMAGLPEHSFPAFHSYAEQLFQIGRAHV